MSDGADELLKMLSDMIGERQMRTNQGLGDLAGKGKGTDPADLAKGYKEVTQEIKTLLSLEKELSKERKAGAKTAAADEKQKKSAAAREARQDQTTVRRNIREFDAANTKAKSAKSKAMDAWIASLGPDAEGGVGGGKGKAGRAKGLGRLPIASVPAALMGNRSAGARVGYALGSMTGLGIAAGLPGLAVGAGAAGMIGAGGAASPTGMSVITKPLEILAGTIGGMVLPQLVRFGGALLDVADWVEGGMKESKKGSYGEKANQISGLFGGLGMIAGAGMGASIGSFIPGVGTVLGGLVGGALGAAGGLAGGKVAGDAAADRSLAIDKSPEAVAERNERFGGQLKSLQNQKMIVQDMIEGLGAKPKMGSNILDIAKETQMATFESPMEVRQRRMWMENIAIVTAKIDKLEKAIRGQ